MNRTNLGSYSDAKSGKLWRYGFEAWCNLEGQYLHIVADLRELRSKEYEVSICSLGVMGTRYGRETQIDKQVTVLPGGSATFKVEKIEALIPIGNVLDIQLR